MSHPIREREWVVRYRVISYEIDWKVLARSKEHAAFVLQKKVMESREGTVDVAIDDVSEPNIGQTP